MDCSNGMKLNLPDKIIHDGYQWRITIFFDDSTKKEIYGDNAYPKTWNEMAYAFLDLTGYYITNPVEEKHR